MTRSSDARVSNVVTVALLVLVVGLSLFLTIAAPPSGPGTPRSGTGVSTLSASFAPGVRSPDQVSHVSPAAAFTLSASGESPAAVSLAWTNPGSFDFQSYNVEESTNGSAGPWTSVGVFTSSADDTALAVDELSPGTTYWWEVVETYGLFSSTETTNVLPVAQPTVAWLNASGVTSTTATLGWTNNATYGGLLEFDNYELYEAVSGGAAGLLQTFTSVGTYNFTVTDLMSGTGYSFYLETNDCIAGCGTSSPTLSTTQSNSVPIGTTLSLTASLSAERQVVDVGQLAYFTCTPSGGVSPYSFDWDFGNGTFVAAPGGTSVSFATAGAPVITCEVTDHTGSSVEVATTITVNTAPTISAVANRTTADIDQPVSFTCSISGGTSPATVGWTFGDGGSAAVGSAVHAYLSPGSVLATCAGVDGAGVSLAASISLAISPLPDAGATVSSAAAAPGTVLKFAAHATNGSGNYSDFAWTFGDGNGASGPNATHSFAGPGTYSVDLVITDSNGGTATARLSVTISPISVALGPLATAVTTSNSLTFSATASGGAGAPYNYTWNFGDGTFGYGFAVAHQYSTAGTYSPTLTVTDPLGAHTEVSTSNVVVSAPPPTPAAPPASSDIFPGVLLLVAVFSAIVVGLVAYRRRRAEESTSGERVAGWVPPTAPSRTVTGMKICPNCQTPNLPIRRTCSHCGRSLSLIP